MILYKKVPGKASYSGKCMGTNWMFTTMENKEFNIKNTPDYIQYEINRRKFPFRKCLSLRLDLLLFLVFSSDLFSSGLYIFCDLISWDFIGSLHIILGKKSQESKIQDFNYSIVMSKDFRKLGLFLGFFFQKLFFCDYQT